MIINENWKELKNYLKENNLEIGTKVIQDEDRIEMWYLKHNEEEYNPNWNNSVNAEYHRVSESEVLDFIKKLKEKLEEKKTNKLKWKL